MSTGSSTTSMTSSARHFIQLYLAAVLEHQNTPSTNFIARETFIIKWKNSSWDLYTKLSGAQKKLMKNRMKVLTKEWEMELEYALKHMGKDEYESTIAKFVGCVIPGRRTDGRGVSAPVVGGGGASDRVVNNGDVDAYSAGGVGGDYAHPSSQDHIMWDMTDEASDNELLDALRVPFTPKVKASNTQGQPRMPSCEDEAEAIMVTDIRHAVAAVLKMRPRDILPVMMRLFP